MPLLSKVASGQNIRDSKNEVVIEPGVTPAFIHATDIGDVDGYDLAVKIVSSVGPGLVRTVQCVKNLWRIYFNTQNSKLQFVSTGLQWNQKHVKVYMDNPYATGAINSGVRPDQIDKVRMIKVVIRDLYESVHNDQVKYMLEVLYKIKLSSEVQYAHYRQNQQLTGMRNGDRFCWVHPDQLANPLPRLAKCGKFNCRIFHYGQFKDDVKQCYNCWGEGHLSRECTKEKCCRVCKDSGHSPGSPLCDHYNDADVSNVLAFGGKGDCLSNHYEHTFVHDGVESKTAEGHFFNKKSMANGQDVLAMECLSADTGKEAKALSKNIRCVRDWDSDPRCYEIMKGILRSKAQGVAKVRECLRSAWEKGQIIVEAVPNNRDTVWGSSMDKEATIHTLPHYWPGRNALGKIWFEIAEELFSGNKSLATNFVHLQREIDLDTGRSSVPEGNQSEGWSSENEEAEIVEEISGKEEAIKDPTNPDITPLVKPSEEEIGDFVEAIRKSRPLERNTIAAKLSRAKSRSASSKGRGKSGCKTPNKPSSPRSESKKRELTSPNEVKKSKDVKNVKLDDTKHSNGSTNGS